MRLDNVRMLTVSFPEMFAFYRDVMGLKVTWGEADGNYASFAGGDGSAGIALFARGEMARAVGTSGLPEIAVAQDRAALVFEVEDLDAFANELKRAGVRFVTEPKDMADWGIRTFHLRDPDGNLIEIFSELRRENWSEGLREADERVGRGKA
jgi:catechol 2,3-dioxygenase-like lactoylglutathione lyase family enzyme